MGLRGASDGAADGTRTHDIQLGKLTLYQLSYSRDDAGPKATQAPAGTQEWLGELEGASHLTHDHPGAFQDGARSGPAV